MRRGRLRPRQRKKKTESTKRKKRRKTDGSEYSLDSGGGKSIFDEPYAVMVSVVEVDEESTDTIELPFGRRRKQRTLENWVVRTVLIVVLVLGGLAFVVHEAVALAVEVEHLVKAIESVT